MITKQHFFVIFFLFMSLIACRNEPDGVETTINSLIKMYADGQIKQLKFIEKGTWIIGELTDEAIEATKSPEKNWKVKVISLESFQEELKKATGQSPKILILSSDNN